MNFLSKNKGIILFYLALIICTQIYIWRIERLEEKETKIDHNVILYVK